jgi:hypothetical protein
MVAKSWLRAGLIALGVLEVAVGVWQYLFPLSFYTGLPTVSLDPPFNEHLMSDVGGLTLALAAVVIYAAVHLEHRLTCGSLIGYIVFAVSHGLFHVTHLAGCTAADAVGLLVLLGVDALVPILLLVLARQVRRLECTQEVVGTNDNHLASTQRDR